MASLTGQDATTDNDESIGVIADGQTGSGIKAKVAADGSGSNRLFVSAVTTSGSPGSIPSVDTTLRYKDMNASTGGVARNTNIASDTPTDVYNETGSGLLFGFVLTLEDGNKDWDIRLIVDSITIFDFYVEDIEKTNFYNFRDNDDKLSNNWMGIDIVKKSFRWKSEFPIVFTTGVRIEVEKVDNGAKKFRAGLVKISGV